MREIKFRAWDKQNKYMIVIFDSVKQEDWFIPSWKDRHEVMQYTGLKDKNGKDIYEGDIFHLGDINIKYTVIWHDTGFVGKQNRTTSSVGLYCWSERIEVIGNIYENPELLSKEV